LGDAERIAIAGAGSIGCFVGGMLALAGRDVAMLTRPRIRDELSAHGLHLTGFDGLDRRLPADRLRLCVDAEEAFAGARYVLVTVKSPDTRAIAEQIAATAPEDAIVVSLQNGVDNVGQLRTALPGRTVLGAMVPFNVVAMGEGRFHRATSGAIQIAQDASDSAARLRAEGLPVVACDDIVGAQWGKLLVNLNNALVALSGLTLREQLMQRPWRRLLAAQMLEGLAAMRAAAIRPVSPTPSPAWLTPHLLRLPDPLFVRVLGRSLSVDPLARSSMWDDLERRRSTEIDHLQGAIIRLAEAHGRAAALNARVLSLVKAAEQRAEGSPRLAPHQIARA
jgi:2-dehydropantoate 2-reductase